MYVRYVRDVWLPDHLAGLAGEEKDLPGAEAARLIDEGYCVAVDGEPDDDDSES